MRKSLARYKPSPGEVVWVRCEALPINVGAVIFADRQHYVFIHPASKTPTPFLYQRALKIAKRDPGRVWLFGDLILREGYSHADLAYVYPGDGPQEVVAAASAVTAERTASTAEFQRYAQRARHPYEKTLLITLFSLQPNSLNKGALSSAIV